jgi:hypothetical protein
LIGWLNVKMSGIPTPYVSPAPSKMWVENVDAGDNVVNVLVVVFVTPFSLAATVTVYFCETPSAHWVCHEVLAEFIVPGTGPDGLPLLTDVPPAGLTVTLDSVPFAAVTVTPADGSALFAPSAGEMLTTAPSGVGLADADPPPPEPPAPAWLLAPPPLAAGLTVSVWLPVHAVTSSANTAVVATAPSRRVVNFAPTRTHLPSHLLPQDKDFPLVKTPKASIWF